MPDRTLYLAGKVKVRSSKRPQNVLKREVNLELRLRMYSTTFGKQLLQDKVPTHAQINQPYRRSNRFVSIYPNTGMNIESGTRRIKAQICPRLFGFPHFSTEITHVGRGGPTDLPTGHS